MLQTVAYRTFKYKLRYTRYLSNYTQGNTMTMTMQKQNTPHKHSEFIKVWADNPDTKFQASVPYYVGWRDVDTPNWHLDNEYRIKPEPRKDLVVFTELKGVVDITRHEFTRSLYLTGSQNCLHNLKLTFDGETGKLKSAEVITK